MYGVCMSPDGDCRNLGVKTSKMATMFAVLKLSYEMARNASFEKL
jgi:hypothetical protein